MLGSTFIAGLDLGQVSDYTAFTIAERIGEYKKDFEYHIRHLQRFKLGTTYPSIVQSVKELLNTEPLNQDTCLVVDATGCGRPVLDMLRDTGLYLVGVTITGGNEVIRDRGDFKVPKRDLVSNLQVLFQSGRLKIAEELPEAQILVSELLNFKVKISTSGHDSYEAWREGVHDDLVLAVALACWHGQNVSDARVFIIQ